MWNIITLSCPTFSDMDEWSYLRLYMIIWYDTLYTYTIYICIYLSQLLSYFLLYLSQCRILTRWDRVTHKYASDSTLIGSDNGLSPGRRQVIMRTITGILLKWSLGNKLQRHFNRNLYIFVQENAIKNVIWKMAGILSRSQCVNSLGPSDAVWRWRSWSTLIQVMACCLTTPSHYLNQCWLITSKVLWHSFADIIIRFEDTNQ